METLRVLAVDDEEGMRLGVARVLRDFTIEIAEIGLSYDFVVDQAETAEEGLELVRKIQPDILLLDHKLPGMSGLDLLAELSDEEKADMLVIMITAYATIEAAVSATKRGTYDFLAKPFTPAELRATVKKAATHLCLTRHARSLEEQKRKVRFEFIRVLGHELKSPIGAVEGYLNILEDKTLGQDIAAYEVMIERSLTRLHQMRRLITDLLNMTRIDSGEKQRNLAPVNILGPARNAIEGQTVEAGKRNIRINLQAPEEFTMQADETELEIIFNNLVSNAVKYNRDNGSVTVQIARDGDKVTIAVSDTGIGMSEDEVAKLFGEFVRIKNKKTRNIMGTGLGLSILKRIARLYDGDVTVESTPDVGTTFVVRLKAA